MPSDSSALTLPPRSVPVATLRTWTPWTQPNLHLAGHAEVVFSGGWTVRDIPVFRRNDGSLSVGVPSAAEVRPDDLIRTDATGRKQYRRIPSFESGAARQHRTRLVLSALATAGISAAARRRAAP